jgi:hypothetical protein
MHHIADFRATSSLGQHLVFAREEGSIHSERDLTHGRRAPPLCEFDNFDGIEAAIKRRLQ